MKRNGADDQNKMSIFEDYAPIYVDMTDVQVEQCLRQRVQTALNNLYGAEPDSKIQSTKTNAGTRKLPITEDVAYCFRAIIEDRPTPKVEKFVDGYSGFLYLDKDGMPEVAMHWQHRFNHAVQRYNDIYRVQMPNITPHVCRHTYCSNMAKAGMNPKTLQYLMGHSDIGVTMNTYTHLGLEDAKDEMIRMEELNAAKRELEKTTGEKPVTQKMFRVV